MSAMACSSAPKKGKKVSRTRRGGASAEEKMGAFKPYHSVSVPKSVDLHSQFQAESKKPMTTIMLRNIPNRYTQASLLQEINKAGFEGTYDFFYLPMDTQNRTNVGYAFINFVSPEELERFTMLFAGYSFEDHASQKVARVSLAHIQGFIENVRHFSHRAVSQSRNSQYRPVVIYQGVRMDLSEAYEQLCVSDSQKSRVQAPKAWTEEANSRCLTNTTQAVKPGPLAGPAPAGPVPPRSEPLAPGPLKVPSNITPPQVMWPSSAPATPAHIRCS